VIDMECRFLTDLRKSAVFAAIARPQHDLGTQRGWDVAHDFARSARILRSASKSARSDNPCASARSSSVRE
jgi:hypothetical protein